MVRTVFIPTYRRPGTYGRPRMSLGRGRRRGGSLMSAIGKALKTVNDVAKVVKPATYLNKVLDLTGASRGKYGKHIRSATGWIAKQGYGLRGGRRRYRRRRTGRRRVGRGVIVV